MKYLLLIALALFSPALMANEKATSQEEPKKESISECSCEDEKGSSCNCAHEEVLTPYRDIRISVNGQGGPCKHQLPSPSLRNG